MGEGAFANRIYTSPHFALSLVIWAATFEVLKAVHLPISVNWLRLSSLYWVGLGVRSVFFAALLALIGLPLKETWFPVFRRFKAQKARLLLFVPFAAWALWSFGVYGGLVWAVVAVVATELYDRNHGDLRAVAKCVMPVLLAALYFFVGLIIVFVYNDAIAAAKNPGGFEWLFQKMDSCLLFGGSVSGWVRDISPRLSPRVFAFAETIYYRMFDLVGAALLLICLCDSFKRAVRFVGTMLTAYYLGLLVFYFLPSMGPFYSCPDHFAHFPQWLKTYEFQRNVLSNAKILSGQFRGLIQVNTDYFIAFPSLHVALLTIVLWFVRPWKRIFYCLIAYEILLIPAILLLEWHYVVDLLGGAVVAAVAIYLNDQWNKKEVPIALKGMAPALPACDQAQPARLSLRRSN